MAESLSCDVVVAGSGFAGSTAARVLRRLGREVVLLERGRHPRFALGESSTPLAAISLEILAERYGLADLRALAAYGRWLEAFPHLRRGLKRGFTFYGHRPGERFAAAAGGSRRLLVAASPTDRIADSHWLREDVDHHLVLEAIEEGVTYRAEVEIEQVEERDGSLLLAGSRDGQPFSVATGFLVDASGGRGLTARLLAGSARHPLAESPVQSFAGFAAQPLAGSLTSSLSDSMPLRLAGRATPAHPPIETSLVYGHFAEVADFAAVAREEGADLPPGPYPDHRAAVHHLTDLGWMYILPFDHGVVSAGFTLDRTRPQARELAASGAVDPAGLWRLLLARYPSLGRQFAESRPVRPIAWLPEVRHRLARAAGPRWLALPSTFAITDALFSTGIAWSLRGIERLGLLFEAADLPGPVDLAAYAALLAEEAEQIDLLVAGAYRAMADFDLAGSYSMLYFAAASFAEASRRLAPERGLGPWEGFLGCRDPVIRAALAEAVARVEELTEGGTATPSPAAVRAFAGWLAQAIEPRNIAGLADPQRANLYPVDLEALVEGAAKLGMTAEEVRAALPRLRG